MKLATSLIYSLAFASAIFARCERLEQRKEALSIWNDYARKFVTTPLPRGFSLCYGSGYFAELKNGAGMQSTLDRRRLRIILRRNNESSLRHELAHLYVDASWKVLPYSASEPLAQALAFSGSCKLQRGHKQDSENLRHRWSILTDLTPCEVQQLFIDIVSATPAVRDGLQLR